LINGNKDLIGSGHVNFTPAVSNRNTPQIYSSHEFFINLTPTGSMDKTILEAVSCSCIPVISNPYFKGLFDENMIVSEGGAAEIAQKLEFWMKAEEIV
jgi:glycosyltransferase involved in cell wall biosynthesis